MATSSRHLSVSIDRPAGEVYAYVADPRNIPAWAQGLGSSVELVDGRWTAESPMGPISFEFAPTNPFGVLDHDVTLPSGEVNTNPMRVLADGESSEVVFTLRRLEGVSDEAYERDAAAVTADLQVLKTLLEA
ncbi:polyketide cyclase [Aeromicrobium sp. Root495]|uniref:SRPBCC family protein n=1 Tax=Aeromicrobium sp. Root495 TaxID=1736550 RepID=UPI0006FE1634|nr:SRPBCC family protein [Aeromicrobium sp. Root495]KQY60579.1 polyketide cyclase [Aeromicrobium sp. Root495]